MTNGCANESAKVTARCDDSRLRDDEAATETHDSRLCSHSELVSAGFRETGKDLALITALQLT